MIAAETETAYFSAADGRRLAYRDEGPAKAAGLPVLCLAGLTRNGRDFEALAAHLCAHRRVLRLDSRGRGASEYARDAAAEYTLAVESADALALLDHLECPRAVIVGTSRGGLIGMGLAAAQPGRIAGLVLNDIGAVVEGQGLADIATSLNGRAHTAPADTDFDALARRLAAECAETFTGVSHTRWLTHAHALYDTGADGRPVAAFDPALAVTVAEVTGADIDLWPLFNAIAPSIPMLAIRGANSDLFARATLDAMAAARPGLQPVEIAGRGHVPFLDEPAALTALDAFLENLS
ncbi:MAG: alpha/beta hydrolase [Pseudomonadota bacterium]